MRIRFYLSNGDWSVIKMIIIALLKLISICGLIVALGIAAELALLAILQIFSTIKEIIKMKRGE